MTRTILDSDRPVIQGRVIYLKDMSVISIRLNDTMLLKRVLMVLSQISIFLFCV